MSSLPDPRDPSSFNHRFVTVASGQKYHLVDQHPTHFVGDLSEAPTLLLTHGFPDLWYGWRYQIREFASRGWRVICPSMLGYFESSKPSDLRAYSYRSVAYDMNSLLEQVGVHQKVIVVGHDWGGMVAWRFADYFPHRVRAIACVCTPYSKPADASTPRLTDALIPKILPNFGYQLYFKSPEAETEMSQVIDQFLQPMHSPDYRRQKETPEEGKMSSWVKVGRLRASVLRQIEARKAGKLPLPPPELELDYYIDAYTKGGLAGPLSWYKTRDINHDEAVVDNLPLFPADIPALHLAASLDAALPPSMGLSKAVQDCFPGGNLEVKVLEGADHWCLQDEKIRDTTTKILGDWIQNVLDGKWKPTGKAVSKL